MTVDIEVEDTHSYQLSNGAVVHNTTSKLFGLTEGWHLPAKAWYMRWVQFRSDDPLIEEYKSHGYPSKELKQYEGTTIIGFPTAPVITNLGLGDKLVTASEATPEEQYKWLQLGEKYWINGESDQDQYGNQISYTLKYNPEIVDFKHFKEMILKYQSLIKCCAVMPMMDENAYEYQPEEALTKVEYEEISRALTTEIAEDIDLIHVNCDNGACPVDFKEIKDE